MKDLRFTEAHRLAYEKFAEENPHLVDRSQYNPIQEANSSNVTRNYRRDTRIDLTHGSGLHKKLSDRRPKVESATDKQKAYMQQYVQHLRQDTINRKITFANTNGAIKRRIAKDMEELNRQYDWDAFNQPAIDSLNKYFVGNDSGNYDMSKGIWIFGLLGSGKSYLVNLFSRFTRELGLKRRFRVVGMEQLADQVKVAESLAPLDKFTKTDKHWCLDDVGEENKIKLYGNEEDVFEKILKQAYRDFLDEGKVLFVTSNLAPKGLIPEGSKVECINSRYGERVCSRIEEMFNFVPLLGENKRRL